MRRSAIALTLVLLLSLLHAPEVLGGGGQAGDPATGKISGPAVSATIVIDPTSGSPTIGRTGLSLQKGTAFSGAIFVHSQAALPPASGGWVLGCDGTHGASSGSARPDLNLNTLTALRFVNNRLRSWIPGSVLTGLFAPLGIALGAHNLPVITDVNNPVCTAVFDDGQTKYILSFTAVIQFEDPTK